MTRPLFADALFPDQALVFASRDFDAVRAGVARIFKPHLLRLHGGSADLQARMYHLRQGDTSVNRLEYGAEVEIDPNRLDDFFLVQIPVAGHASIACGNRRFDSTPLAASLVSPTLPLHMRWHAGNAQVCVRFERGMVEQHCAAHLGHALDEPLERADVIAVGPGLGRSAWARSALQAVLATANKPLVIDADALNLLAEAGNAARSDWILTPHPGEAGRLLDVSAQEIQRDRLAALDRLIERYAGTVVLKGAGTLVGGAGRIPGLCERGNPGMATAGTGDVLTGAIAGILAQCRDPWAAARAGVLVHAMAGDAAARGGGERGVLASDLTRELHHCVNL